MNSKVRELRIQRNIPAATLIDLLGISKVNYLKKERGIVRFSLSEAKKISDFFAMSIEEIFFDSCVSKIETA
jgi:DNA-binding XRE family transcriptional regulator